MFALNNSFHLLFHYPYSAPTNPKDSCSHKPLGNPKPQTPNIPKPYVSHWAEPWGSVPGVAEVTGSVALTKTFWQDFGVGVSPNKGLGIGIRAEGLEFRALGLGFRV